MGMQHFGLHEQMAHHNLDAKAHFDRYSIHQWQAGPVGDPGPGLGPVPGTAHGLLAADAALLHSHI